MKHLFTIGLVLLLPGFLTAQKLSDNFKISVSEPFPVVDASDKQYFPIGDGVSISVKTRGEKVVIQRFSGADMKEISRKDYEDFPKYNKVQKVLLVGDKLMYISEAFNKKEKTFSVYVREINTSDGTFSKIRKLFTTKREVAAVRGEFGQSGGFFDMGMSGNKFDVSSSSDGSKVLIQYRLTPNSKRDKVNKDEIGFHVFDADMNEIWGSVATMPYTEKEMNNIAYTVTKDGKARMLALKREEKKYEMFTIDDSGLSITPLEIPGEVFFQRLKLQENDEGNIVCAGFYANGIVFRIGTTVGFSTDGFAIFKILPSGKILNWRMNEFTSEFIKLNRSSREQKTTDKREEKDKAGIEDLSLVEFHIEKDGSITLVGERQYVTIEYVYVNGKMKQKNIAHFGNVVVVKLGSDGEVSWMQKVPKHQRTKNSMLDGGGAYRGGMGIKYIRNADSHYVLYLDNIKNNDIPLGKAPFEHQDGLGGFLVAVKIDDQTGEMERHPILDLREEIDGIKIHQFFTSRIFDIDTNSMMLETYIKGKQDAMIRLDLVK